MARPSLPLPVTLAVRIYGALLIAYPREFRHGYGPPMVQLFRDCCRDAYRQHGAAGLFGLGRLALLDLAVSGLRERLTRHATVPLDVLERNPTMSRSTFLTRALPYLLTLLFGLALGYVNLHTDETPIVALPLLAATFVLGCLSPRGAWRWGILTGLWLPLSLVFAALVKMKLPYPDSEWSGALIGGLLFGLVGAYLGVLARWMFDQMAHSASDTSR